jgi:formylglycine-generating enzyme required for sulfatase activity
MTPFFMDQNEVTVARWRRALADGLAAATEAILNNGPLATMGGPDQTPECTWSSMPLGREGYPLNCVTWQGARAFCQFYGGDLPTEAQWEYAAVRTAKGAESTYPWGEDQPTCDHAVYARAPGFSGLDKCLHLGFGVQPIDASLMDVSSDEVFGLAGSLTEWALDSYRSYSSACWRSTSLVNPGCWEDAPEVRAKRGSSWGTNNVLDSARRDGTRSPWVVSLLGFRCVRGAG